MVQHFLSWPSLLVFGACILRTKSAILQSSVELSDAYDFVVVGGGTAGNVIANRLTENPNVNVLVIEAGGLIEGVVAAEQPFSWPRLAGSQFDWNFTTVPQAGLGGRPVSFTRGRTLGGSSSINGMDYTRGSSEDYDRIAQLTGDDGWSWNNLRPYFLKNEKWTDPPDNHDTMGQFDPSVHGFEGILSVSLPGFPRSVDQRVLDTLQNGSEFQFNLDVNSGNHLGFSWCQLTVTSRGRRDSSATSFLGPDFIERPNLHILLNSQVTRLLQSETTKFDVVEFIETMNGLPDVNKTVLISKETILSAGTIATPSILLHSGIGDLDFLTSLGIAPTHHLPSVGRNLTDHVVLIASWSVNSTDTFDTVLRNQTLLDQFMEEWRQNGTGFFAGGVSNHAGALRLPANASIFDHINDPAAGPNTGHYELTVLNGLLADAVPTGNFISLVMTLFTPVSRGSLTINSTNPLSPPLIDPGLLTHEFDRFALREALRAARRFISSPAWDGYILEPFGDLATIDLQDDAQVDGYIRDAASAGLHTVASASMSPKGATWGVTDPDLKVKGIDGLRIVDASVIPHVPAAHTQAGVYVVAERAADIIKGDWGL